MPAVFTWESCVERITSDMELLCDEIERLALVFRETKFFGASHTFPGAHVGMLMACMSKLDFLSLSMDPRNKSQSARMVEFLDRYVAASKPKENRLILKMLRHSLMHSGTLRFMTNKAKTEVYTWRLYWSEAMGGDRHYEISEVDAKYQDQILTVHHWKYPGMPKPRTMCLHLRLTTLAHDLQKGAHRFLNKCADEPTMQKNLIRAYRMVVMEAADT